MIENNEKNKGIYKGLANNKRRVFLKDNKSILKLI